MTRRVNWDDYYLGIADAVAVRADCTRRKVGAVVVDPAVKHIIATGYNGAPPGEPGCLSDNACPRGRHYKVLPANFYGLDCDGRAACACGSTWPCPDAVEAGSSYDTGPGACIALHAEQNATIRAGERARSAYLYITDEPCDGCWKLLRGAGYSRVVWYGGEWTPQRPDRTMKLWLSRLLPDPIAKWLNSRSGKPTPSS